MIPWPKAHRPLFELTLVLVAAVIGWAEVSLYRTRSQAEGELESIKERFGVLEREGRNRREEAQRVEQENDRMSRVFAELQSEFTNELSGVRKTEMEDALKLPDALKIEDEYSVVAERVESGVNELHSALTNFVALKSPGELQRFRRKKTELKDWIAKQKERAEAERFRARIQDLNERIRREPSLATNASAAITKDLDALLDEVHRAYTNYLADARYAEDNVGQPITSSSVLPHLASAGQKAGQLFELARQARMNAKAVESFLQPRWQSEAQQRAARLQLSILNAQARLGTNTTARLQKETNNTALPAFEAKSPSSAYWLTLFPLVLAQIGVVLFLVVAIYRRVVVERLRLGLYESWVENKVAHLEKLAVWQAHEIKQPLAAITAWLRTLQQSLTKGSAEHRVATAIREQTDRLDQMTKDFLKLAGPLEPNLVPVKAEPTLREIQNLFQPQLEEQLIRLNVDSAAEAPFCADPQQLKQVLINLVQNAADSIEHRGSITLRSREARVALRGQATDVVVLEVEDDGPGIPPKVQERLFEPFFSTKATGTGLGLPIAARIIDKHGGALEFNTAPGKGTTFGVVLPRAHKDEIYGENPNHG